MNSAAFQRRIQKYGWDKAAPIYERSWQAQLKPAQDVLLEMANLKDGEDVLDVACGTGLVTFRAAKQIGSGKITGIDISEKMIQTAGQISQSINVSNVNFICMDAEDINLPESSFDAVICALGLLYVPDPLLSLNEMKKVLKPGGRIVNAVWGDRKNCGWAGIFPVIDARVRSEVCPMFFHLGTGEALKIYYEKAGLVDIEVKRINTTLHYSDEDEALAAAFAGGPVALAYSKFDDKIKREAHEEYLASIDKYKHGRGYNIPGEFVIACGRKI